MNQSGIAPIFNLKRHHQKIKIPQGFSFRDLSEKYRVFPLKQISIRGKKRILLAMLNIYDHHAIMDAEFRSNTTVIPVQADAADIQWLIETFYYGLKMSAEQNPPEPEPELTQDLFSQFELITNANRQEPTYKADGHLSKRF